MNFVKLNITAILLGGFLFLWASNGQALVTPEHYEKLKKQNRQKTMESERGQSPGPVRLQVHRPGQGHPSAGQANPK
jgi:hypothetical protein